MKRKYKEYTIVDNKGLKGELENAYLTCNEDLYEFFEKNKLLVVNKKMRIEETDFEFMKEKTYIEFVEKNKVSKDSAYEYIHIIEIYGPMVLVESSSDYGSESFIDRIERLEEELTDVRSDIREIFKEAKESGFDIRVMKKVLQLKKLDENARNEYDIIVDSYRKALGV